MSVIRYRFKSSKDFDTITFEGNGIHVWELKDEIIAAKKLARSADFDLVISNAQSSEGEARLEPGTTLTRARTRLCR